MQTMPDRFYEILTIFTGVSLLGTGRVLPLYAMWWKPSQDRNNTQRNRYLVALVGLMVSGAYFTYLLSQYSPSEIILGIHELPMFFSIVYWMAIGMNAACFVLSIVFTVRTYLRPAHYTRITRETQRSSSPRTR